MVIAEERDFYTVAEAAKVLHVSPSTVWRWIAAKLLPANRVGGPGIRISEKDLGLVVQPARPSVSEPAAPELPTEDRPLTLDEWRNRPPPTPEELARRHEVVHRILKNRRGRSIAPLTSVDLIRQVRQEREERYRSWLEPLDPSS